MAYSFENGIFGFIPEKEWLDVSFNVTRPNDPIDGLFTDEKTNNLVAYWQQIANQYQVPMMAQFHGFDTEAQTTFRIPVDVHNIEKGLIKVKLNQSERMRELLRSGVRQDEMYDYVINDGVRLADQVVTRTKVAKNELLATGKVTIIENNLNLTVDYGVEDAQTGYELDFSVDADIPAQIQQIVDNALDYGTTITGMVTSRKNLRKMQQNAAVQKAVNGTLGVGALVSSAALNAYLTSEFGIISVITNDLTYGADYSYDANGRPSVTQERYFPQDKVTFFGTAAGNGKLGAGLWGDPPESDAGQFMSVGEATDNRFVYVSQWMEKDPAVLWTKASGLFMPVLYNPRSLWIATVVDPAAKKLTVVASSNGTVTVSPAKASGNIYKVKTSTVAAPVAECGASVRSWSTWDGTSKLTLTAGDYITVAEADSDYKVVNSGSATVSVSVS